MDSRLSFGTSTNSTGRIMWRSTWSSIAAYNVNDLVGWTGGVYIALQASTNILPSNSLFWDLVIASGSVTSFNTRTGSIIAVSSDLSDHDAALGAPLLDASGFIKAAQENTTANAQTSTSYTIVAADRGKLVTLSNAGAIAVTVPAASGSFPVGWFCTVTSLGAGVATLTPGGGSTIDGAASITLKQFQSITLTSVAGNWVCLRSRPVASFADITGTAAMTQGGTGVDLSAGGGTTMVLAQNASHVISARNLVAADIPSLAASIITSGALALARGGTAVDLSASGGTTAVLAQDASHVISARNLVAADIPSLASRTETLTNKALITATSGNNVNLLNSQDTLGAVTGTGGDNTLYTFTIPANTVQAGKGIKLKAVVSNNNNVAVTYKVILGATTIKSFAGLGLIEDMTVDFDILNNAAVQNAQTGIGRAVSNAAIVVNQSITSAENFANALVLKITGNQASTNTITPKKWILELIQ